jgi:acyl-coenzyme A thioesterase PaaI-like protein
MCFLCGIDNPIGLHLKFYTDNERRCIARFQPKPEHQGYPGQLHGGIISMLLTGAMGRVAFVLGRTWRRTIALWGKWCYNGGAQQGDWQHAAPGEEN